MPPNDAGAHTGPTQPEQVWASVRQWAPVLVVLATVVWTAASVAAEVEQVRRDLEAFRRENTVRVTLEAESLRRDQEVIDRRLQVTDDRMDLLQERIRELELERHPKRRKK